MKRHFGIGIAKLRKARGWTQHKLALAAGLSRTSVSNIENGKDDPKLSSLHGLATALGPRVWAVARYSSIESE